MASQIVFGKQNNLPYTLKHDEGDDFVVIIYDDQKIGRIEFSEDLDSLVHEYLLIHMDIENPHQRQGLGENALRFFKQVNGNCFISARSNDGRKLENGSHLTGGGVPFVAGMRKKGLITPSQEDMFNESDSYFD